MKHLYNDWDAVVGRAKGLWAPRWRTASVGATTTTAAITDGNTDADAAAAAVSGDGLSATAGAATAARSAAMGSDEKLRAAAQEGVGSARGGEDGSSSANLVGGDGKDAWGGCGSPADVVEAKEYGSGGAGGAAATTGAGEKTMVVEVASEAGERKGRWARGAWSAVDVRSVQSRLSRMVDDTSARIRSNVVKVSASVMGMMPYHRLHAPPPLTTWAGS